jgi:ABC-type uncharacterized transport system substrate-binding protein
MNAGAKAAELIHERKTLFPGCGPGADAVAHPHVFVDASLTVVANADGTVKELRNVWRFDEFFSSSVLMDFDKNADLKLSHDELEDLSQTIHDSLADYNYFTFITQNGKQIDIAPPDKLHADYKDNRLLVFFAVKPKTPMTIKGKLSFGVHDPTLYTAIDFAKDSDLVTEGQPFSACKHKVVRPNPDEVIAQNQASLTDAFFNDPTGTNMSKLFATRLELTC